VKIYTKTGDDGTTGLYYGGRVEKHSPRPVAYGDVDETQSALGVARAHSSNEELNAVLVTIQRDLWIVMSELATDESNRHKLVPGTSCPDDEMIARLEGWIDSFGERFEQPRQFVVPGVSVVSAFLDLARAVARRAERSTSVIGGVPLSLIYMNRLSDLLWTLARWEEGTAVLVREVTPSA
jgi:cob(I)alamin adenosyltransferase